GNANGGSNNGGEGGTGNVVNDGGSGGGGGTPGECIEITDVTEFAAGQTGLSFFGGIEPMLAGADPDSLGLYLPPESTGSNTLTLPAAADVCLNGTGICVVGFEDETQEAVGAYYFATSGTLDLGTTAPPFYIAGSLSDVTLVEATLDPDTGAITEVVDGRCVHIENFAFQLDPPTPGWTCAAAYYDEVGQGAEEQYCDCECGAVDPDCSNPELEIFPCAPGQTCGATAQCEGTPTDWTCGDDTYDQGAGNGCDCNCGLPDPDCALAGETVNGCEAGEVCQGGGCFDAAVWTCDDTYFADGTCDCGCGLHDVDCADALVASCDYCNDEGSCSTTDCPGTINPVDNSICTI
ncbi:MAG: hypothetical protein HOW73_12375, partial [Polyangiaceae bacterium]|nr:hypothetical protein [Polyangiaceae bacterium]